jgi:hypothetical protein
MSDSVIIYLFFFKYIILLGIFLFFFFKKKVIKKFPKIRFSIGLNDPLSDESFKFLERLMYIINFFLFLRFKII